MGALVAGLAMAVAMVLTILNLRPYAGPPLPAEVDSSGASLPLRPGYAGRQAASLVALGLAAGGLTHGVGGDWLMASLFGVCGVAAALLLVRRARHADRIHVNQSGISVPTGWGQRGRVAWRDIREVTVAPSWRPHLVIHAAHGPDLWLRLPPQSWSADELADGIRRRGEPWLGLSRR